ncbi:oxidoreductase [Campylobacter sp. MIT 99-7217]|uniref:chaperone NapD n=1 Tax=Campylobacter sp. MIT 99-7217 TaxID=535091 RepID=UPI001157097E|nr:chaperone NapD [Campylobacter sp. MIT 99-7217]TQR33006.1 oxidoreductase [Campylobacter sp. MIT 99-7217]
MNISSALVVAKQEDQERVLEAISSIDLCSVELIEDEKIIVLIESESLDEELKAFKALEKIKNTISVSMVFSYQDLDDEIQKAGKVDIEQRLDEKKDAEDIEYYGNIFQKY